MEVGTATSSRKRSPDWPWPSCHRGLRGRVSIKERSPSFYLPGEARRVHESALGHSWSHRLGTASCRGQEGGLELMPGWRAGYIGLYPVLWCTWCLLA